MQILSLHHLSCTAMFQLHSAVPDTNARLTEHASLFRALVLRHLCSIALASGLRPSSIYAVRMGRSSKAICKGSSGKPFALDNLDCENERTCIQADRPGHAALEFGSVKLPTSTSNHHSTTPTTLFTFASSSLCDLKTSATIWLSK